jgi:hypothetical protein
VNRPAELPDDIVHDETDRDTVERVLTGRIPPDDAPAAYREAARALRALRSPASANELMREADAVRQALVLLERPTPSDHRVTRRRGIAARARVGALVVAGMMVATTGAAAANVLPGRLERPVAHVLSHVGITVGARAASPSPTVVPSSSPASDGSRQSIAPQTNVAAGGTEHAAVRPRRPSARKNPADRAGDTARHRHSTGPRGHPASGHANGHAGQPPGHDVPARGAHADERSAHGNAHADEPSQRRNRGSGPHGRAEGHTDRS